MNSFTNNAASLVSERQLDITYRRGVLLGMTMAEIMILLLFCMLMAFVIKLDDVELDQEKIELADKILIETGLSQSNVEDNWQKIELIGAISSGVGYESLREIVANAEPGTVDLGNAINGRVKAALDQYREMEGDLRSDLGRNPTLEEITTALIEREKEASKFAEFEEEIDALEELQQGLKEEESLTEVINNAEKLRDQLSDVMNSGENPTNADMQQILSDAEAYNSLVGEDVQANLEQLLAKPSNSLHCS